MILRARAPTYKLVIQFVIVHQKYFTTNIEGRPAIVIQYIIYHS